jgi:replicative DNA helicase
MKQVEIHRGPPHSVDAELGALASATLTREALCECLDKLTLDHFYVPAHQLIFSIFAEQQRKDKPLALPGLTQELMDGFPVEHLPLPMARGRLERGGRPVISLEELGGAHYLTSVFTFIPTAAHVSYYINILREKFIARTIIAKCTELVRVAYDEQTEIGEVLEQTQATLTEIIMQAEHPDIFRNLTEGVTALLEELEHRYHHRGDSAVAAGGLATGFMDFDRMTYGLRPEQLIIIGARPSQGKTAMAMNMAYNIATLNEVPVGVFSMEMSYQEIIERMFCGKSGITINKFREGFLSDKEFEDAPDHGAKLGSTPIWIDDTPALTTSAFKARARLMKMKHKVRAIIVDYLQLMRSLSKRSQDARWIEVTEISGTLKAVAKELKVPVIVCCQLNREAEARDASFCKPKLSDLRESGSIEQDADVVVMLWRPDRHLAPPKFGKKQLARILHLKDDLDAPLWLDEPNDNNGQDDKPRLTTYQLAERDRQILEYAGFNVVKQRNGPVNDLRLRFIGNRTLFQNVTEKLYSNDPTKRQQR